MRAASLAVSSSGLIIMASPSFPRRYSTSALYSGVRTLAMAAQLPTWVAIVQHKRFSSSELVTAIIKSASSMPASLRTL